MGRQTNLVASSSQPNSQGNIGLYVAKRTSGQYRNPQIYPFLNERWMISLRLHLKCHIDVGSLLSNVVYGLRNGLSNSHREILKETRWTERAICEIPEFRYSERLEQSVSEGIKPLS
jgi:hypothetical protein